MTPPRRSLQEVKTALDRVLEAEEEWRVASERWEEAIRLKHAAGEKLRNAQRDAALAMGSETGAVIHRDYVWHKRGEIVSFEPVRQDLDAQQELPIAAGGERR